MSIEPKIKTNNDIEKLKNCYLVQKMSTVDIEKNSEKIFGFYLSRGLVYRSLLKHNVCVRNKSTSISRAKSTLDIDTTFLGEDIIEWTDGFLLGDGYIGFKEQYQNARFIIGSAEIEWTKYAMQKYTSYNPSPIKTYNEICERRPNPIWESKTKTHPDIVSQAQRWYGGEGQSKKIPQDVRITPTSVMLWYLGDGSFTQFGDNSSCLRLATCAFDRQDLEKIVIPKLRTYHIDAYVDDYKNDIHVRAESTKDFFNFIGWNSPIACYDHKFNVPEWMKLIRLSEIVKTDQEKWRAQYYYKSGQVECTKSPGGKMLLFTREQASKLQSMLTA